MMFPKNPRKRSLVALKNYAAENPECEVCCNMAQDVHHITPKSNEGGHDIPQNFISLCRVCHDFAHAHVSWAKTILSQFKTLSHVDRHDFIRVNLYFQSYLPK